MPYPAHFPVRRTALNQIAPPKPNLNTSKMENGMDAVLCRSFKTRWKSLMKRL
ncbi:hypothetical protein GDO78_010393 [Eleutherodactylus coqui]|uniref:Uncharacterized protein n=1 Tax=Eleutherodactylus coqui TaxID=57060 RepID=A0A8J6K5Z9_ELECQ|nr:hypothetical protein GDO78_010393 [Eleutherodactylus coqui]